jgi:hypothetical protein
MNLLGYVIAQNKEKYYLLQTGNKYLFANVTIKDLNFWILDAYWQPLRKRFTQDNPGDYWHGRNLYAPDYLTT